MILNPHESSSAAHTAAVKFAKDAENFSQTLYVECAERAINVSSFDNTNKSNKNKKLSTLTNASTFDLSENE